MPLDLKNPSAKEMLIVGGGALGLGLIYMYLTKGKTAAAAPAAATPTTGSGPSLASDGAPFTGSGMRVAGAPSTGNAFSDANLNAPLSGLAATSTETSATTATTSSKPAVPKIPVLHATQGAQDILGGGASPIGAGGSGAAPNIGAQISTTATQVYQALIKKGLQPFQAAGIMGNIQNESGFRTEVAALDTNNKYSYGLIQWNAGSYPNAGQYVTGNTAKDFQNQINAIVALFKSHNIGGSTAAQVASNWAAQVEVCQGCQPGGSQNAQRQFNATSIFQNVLSGKYAVPKVKATATAGTKAATPQAIANLFSGVKLVKRAVPVKAKAAKPAAAKAKPINWTSTMNLVQAFQAATRPKVNKQAAATAKAQNRRGLRAV